MTNILKNSVMVLMIILFLSAELFAGDSVTIGISCIIPAIPGVNTPDVISKEKNAPHADDAKVKDQENLEATPEIKDKIPQDLPDTKKNNKENKFLLSEENNGFQIIRTLYGR